jgi:hypothetical protein
MASRSKATSDQGDILSNDQHNKINFDDIQMRLKFHKDIEDEILAGLLKRPSNKYVQELFRNLVGNFKGKDTIIRDGMRDLDNEIKELTAGDDEPKSFETELNKLRVSQLKTFKWILLEELKREELSKQEALKKFMAECVNNDLAEEILE